MKVAIYTRVSTDEQELEHQVADCYRFCEYKGFEVAQVYREKMSGANSKRPEYLRLVADLREMKYGGVVVFRLDRLGRNSRELALLIDELENKGLKVFSVKESFDTSTPMGRAMREMAYIFAELERDQIGEATKQRLASIKASGKRLGQKPASDYQVSKVKTLHLQEYSLRAIAKRTRLSHVTVSNIVNQKGYYSPSSKSAGVAGC